MLIASRKDFSAIIKITPMHIYFRVKIKEVDYAMCGHYCVGF